MNEGKLIEYIKKRIAWLDDRLGKDNPPCADLRIYEVKRFESIFNEAKKDFPQIPNPQEHEYPYDSIFRDFEKWSKKWLGDKK